MRDRRLTAGHGVHYLRPVDVRGAGVVLLMGGRVACRLPRRGACWQRQGSQGRCERESAEEPGTQHDGLRQEEVQMLMQPKLLGY